MRRTTTAFSEEHEAFREGFRRFLELEVEPHYPQWRAAGAIPRSLFEIAGENGFLGITASEEYGGAGLDDPLFGLVMIEEIVSIGATGLAVLVAAHSQVAIPALARVADEATQATLMPGLIAGTTLASISGSTSDGIQICDVPGIGSVDIVLARGVDGVLLVPLAEHSVVAVPAPLGAPEAGLGDVLLEGASPAHRTLGGATAGTDLLSDWYLWLAAVDLAAAEAALDLATAYTTQRTVFGEPLSSFENTRVSLARCSADSDAVAALMVSLMRERSDGPLPPHRTAALRIASSALHSNTVDQALQLHGGYGYMSEYPIAQAFADAGLTALLSRLEPEIFVAESIGL